jgi:hypothetical protein
MWFLLPSIYPLRAVRIAPCFSSPMSAGEILTTALHVVSRCFEHIMRSANPTPRTELHMKDRQNHGAEWDMKLKLGVQFAI